MPTIVAIMKAIRAFFTLLLVLLALECLFDLGIIDPGEVMTRRILGFAFLATIALGMRQYLLQQRQMILARRLIQLSPEARNVEAVKILVGALGSDKTEVRESVVQELKRLTGEDYGEDAAAWKRWIRQKERGKDVVEQRPDA